MTERRRIPIDEKTGQAVAMPQFSAGPPPEPEESVSTPLCDCPRLDKEEWHEVESDWSDIAFLKTGINAALGIPVGFSSARDGLEAKARALGATIPADAMVLLGEGRVRRPLMLEVEDVPAGTKDIDRPGGVVFTRLLPAHFGAMKRVVAETEAAARERYGRKPDATWIWYLTCRICSAERDFETLILAHYAKRP